MPPGSSRRSTGLVRWSGGMGIERRRSSSSRTGAGPSITWPVIMRSPVCSALRIRTSTGSMSSASASRSICASCATATWTAPKPRMAPHGGLLVNTTRASISAPRTRYGPAAKHAALPTTRKRRRRVRATVEQHVGLHVDQLAVAVRAVLVAQPRRVAMDVAVERLLPAVDHLHGPAGAQREQAGVDLDRHVLPAAERAADAGQVQPHRAPAAATATRTPGRGRRAATAWRRAGRRRRPRPGSPRPDSGPRKAWSCIPTS